MKPLLIAEDNPLSQDPRYALYPKPENSTGGRLCRLIMGLSVKDYIKNFDRVDLCAGKWNAKEAQSTAWQLMKDSESDPARVFVLLGKKVTRIFWPGLTPPFHPMQIQRWEKDRYPRDQHGYDNRFEGPYFNAVVLPHPSGRNREWSKPNAFVRAREALVEAGVFASMGEPAPQPPLKRLPWVEMTTARPARCNKCGVRVLDAGCKYCGVRVFEDLFR